jgi:hypothetical protein
VFLGQQAVRRRKSGAARHRSTEAVFTCDVVHSPSLEGACGVGATPDQIELANSPWTERVGGFCNLRNVAATSSAEAVNNDVL